MRGALFTTLAYSVLGLAGCASDASSSAPAEPPVALSQKQRLTTPDVPSADAEALRAGNTAFATDLYADLAKASPSSNFAFSPYSISLALAMTYAGAAGNTATQMASTMHFTVPPAQLHNAFDGLDLALMSRGTGGANAFKLSVVDSTWGSPEIAWNASFLDTLAIDYGDRIRLTDFSKPEPARVAINGWVDGQTEHRIPQLLAPNLLDVTTRLVLVNAIYFNAGWASPFQKSATYPLPFHGAAGEASVPFMSQLSTMPYAKGTGYRAFSLPYAGNELSLIAVLPDSLATFEAGFTATEAQSIATSLSPTQVSLKLPKFKVEGAPINLKDLLAARGMVDAFDSAADFSGMASAQLYIQQVVHQAFVDVDEDGTEAAAATAVIVAEDASVSINVDPIVQLTLDHPFVFFIRDNQTGAILFLGRVAQL